MSRIPILLAALSLGCATVEAEQGDNDGVAAADIDDLIRDGVRVEVAEIKSTDAQLTLSLPGEVEGSRDALLSAALGGLVESVDVVEGQEVRRGQTLMRIDAAIYAASYEQAKAQYDLAAAELERTRKLGDLASASRLQSAETQAISAEAGMKQARARLNRAVIAAPFDGVVAQLAVDAGEVAPPSSPVARVVALDPVNVTLSVSDRDIVALSPGMSAYVTTAARSGVFPGQISNVSAAADLRTRSFIVDVSVPNADRALLPGMIARVKVEGDKPDGVVIPQDWIVTRLRDQGVFVDNNGAAEWREVTLGDIIHDQVVVESGLDFGDRIVISGQRNLVDGDPLIIARAGVCCSAGRATFQ